VDLHGPAAALGEQDRELADAWRGLTAYRNQMDARRTARATTVATDLVADLVALAAGQPDAIVEDALCRGLGPLLGECAKQEPIDERPGPHHVAQAIISAAAAAVEATTGQPDTWGAPWRVLTAVAGILPYPDREAADSAIARLRINTPGVRVLRTGPALSGPVLWTRDRYGSRFAVTAPITTQGQPERWYLWDIDACGHNAFTVHSGFYATAEAALTAWQAGVGPIAAPDTALAAVDDPWLVAELLPVEQGFMRPGGESVEQFAEYHRSRRLGEVVKQALPRPGTPSDRGLDSATAAAEFTAWLRARDDDPTQLPDNLAELATELAESWCINHIDTVFATCSPHRVALCVQHTRGYYVDEFADQLVALLPAWTRWLAARNATPPELADRALPYAQGQPHPQITVDGHEPDYLARVTE
jgi:hypothetical protein